MGGTMTRLMEFGLKDSDATVVVAVKEPPGTAPNDTVYRSGLPRDLVERSSQTLDKAISRVKPAAEALIAAMTDLTRRPDELTATFGIEFSGSMGAVIASTAATANISITLTWRVAQSSSVVGQG